MFAKFYFPIYLYFKFLVNIQVNALTRFRITGSVNISSNVEKIKAKLFLNPNLFLEN